MDDEGALYRLRIEVVRQVLNHLVVVTVTGKTFNLRNLRLNTMVKAEDTDPLAFGVLDTGSK